MDHTKINLNERGISNIQDFEGETLWDFNLFKKKFKIRIQKIILNDMEFDIIGSDASLINSFRRILIAEIPTMAIEKVYLYNNTSVIQDEVLCHRLGLIPLKADPRLFNFKILKDGPANSNDTLDFELNIKCTKNLDAPVDSNLPDQIYQNSMVYTSDIKWIPIGNQGEIFKKKDVGPVEKDILIAKLKPGHVIHLKMHAVKGIGSDHAKFSPVCTAFYRLLPEIIIKEDVYNENAITLQKCFSKGVIDLVEEKGKKKAIVTNSRLDQCSRNVFRYNELKDCVQINKIRNHYIVRIESTGAMKPSDLFEESVKILMNKCKLFLKEINKTCS